MAADVLISITILVSILAFLPLSDALHLSSKINVTNVLHQYSQFCGPGYLCNTASGFQSPLDGVDDDWTPCPKCFCDSNCYRRGDCCPDKLPLTCEDTVLVIGKTDKNVDRYYKYMVSECPENTKTDLRAKCNEKITKNNYLQNYPVADKTNLTLTFKNRFCAKCNNISDVNAWELNITCPIKRYSIAQYSSAEEIWDAVTSENCAMKYDPVHFDGNKVSCKPDKEIHSQLVNQCNVTGIWKTFDKDIEWACRKYTQKFGIFRNVFCYLCNMGEMNITNLKRECNNTGLWDKYSATISKACVTEKAEPWFLPYPNRYCFRCNTNGNTPHGVLTDAKIYLNETYRRFEQFPFLTDVTILLIEEQNNVENEALNIKQPLDTIANTEFEINITRLYTAYREAGGKSSWCNKEFQTGIRDNCLCDPSCYFNGMCCPNFVLTRPRLVNIHSSVFTDDESQQNYLLIGLCPKTYKNKTISRKCETPTVDDISTLIPVNNHNRFRYRNMYCNFCNEKQHENLTFWKIHVRCPIYISFKHFTSLKLLMTFANTAGCILRTMPPDPKTKKETLVAKCNVTGSWLSYDRDIEYACENPLVSSFIMSEKRSLIPHKRIFQNVFCEICNHNKLFEAVATCNITGVMTFIPREIINNCTTEEKNDSSYPFKNEFCQQCNKEDSLATKNELKPTLHTFSPQVTFRSLFSIRDLVIKERETVHYNRPLVQGRCESNHVYDQHQNRCRKVFCAPGKHLDHEKYTCVPLFDNVYDLRYQISIRLESEYLTSFQITKIMQTFHSNQIIIKKISEKLNLNPNNSTISLDWYYAEFNLPCHTSDKRPVRGTSYASQSEKENSTDVQILKVLINLSVSIKTTTAETISRVSTEEQLLNFTEDPLVLEVGNESVKLIPKLDMDAFYLKSTIHMSDSKKQCKLLYEKGNEFSDRESSLKPLLVNKLLFCAQIEIGHEEFGFNSSDSILIKKLNSVLNHDKYQIYPNDKIRLCLEDYVAVNKVKKTSILEFALTIFTFLCICLSLICLLLTLTAHFLFPVLQSLAGKNIICLAVSLIFAQLCILISGYAFGTIFCQIIGALTHYFWMSYFCCMNICSFHMYHVFTSTSTLESTRYKDRKMLMRYCIYSFGIPAVIVLINVAVGLILNDGNKTLYGGKKCFHSETLPLILSFIVPVIVICIINIIFFSLAACKIKFTKNDTSTGNSQYKIGLYVKLFILTGVTWVFQIADTFFDVSLFSYIVTLLNGCQGVYIFISYVCTKRVLRYIKNRNKKQSGSNGISETPTKSRIFRSQTITDSPRITKITTANGNGT